MKPASASMLEGFSMYSVNTYYSMFCPTDIMLLRQIDYKLYKWFTACE